MEVMIVNKYCKFQSNISKSFEKQWGGSKNFAKVDVKPSRIARSRAKNDSIGFPSLAFMVVGLALQVT